VEVVSLPFPKEILLVVVHPNIRIDTKESRAILKPAVFLKDYVSQSANLAGFVSGCFTKDIDLMQRCFKDIIIEPQRQSLIPGFSNAKQAAKENGALGFSISGSGPTVFALAKSKRSAYSIKDAIVKAFEDSGVGPADSWVSQVSKKGASLQ
jgi:homoserine kinase